jgi:hypothetical protein
MRGGTIRQQRRAHFLGSGEVSEWSMEAVLKTVEPLRGSGGSNPSLSDHF